MEASSILLLMAFLLAALSGCVLFVWLARKLLGGLRAWSAATRTGNRGIVSYLLRNGLKPFNRFAQALLSVSVVSKFTEKVSMEIRKAGFETNAISVTSLLVGVSLGAGAAMFALSLSFLAAFASVVCLFVFVNAWAVRKAEQRKSATREEIPEALQSMKACFQVGYSLPQTVHEVAASTKGPLSALFLEAEGVLETGGGLNRALSVLKADGNESELVFLATALEIQHRTGGSMQRILEAARQSVSDELELKRTLRTQTAQAKLSAQIVTVMPFALLAVFSLLSPGFLTPFFESPMGIVLLAAALGMQTIGVSIVRKLLKVGQT